MSKPKYEPNQWDFFTYIGPSLPDLEYGETVHYSGPTNEKGEWWMANINMPLSGAFCGFISPNLLVKEDG